jgi:hypothetical protein
MTAPKILQHGPGHNFYGIHADKMPYSTEQSDFIFSNNQSTFSREYRSHLVRNYVNRASLIGERAIVAVGKGEDRGKHGEDTGNHPRGDHDIIEEIS